MTKKKVKNGVKGGKSTNRVVLINDTKPGCDFVVGEWEYTTEPNFEYFEVTLRQLDSRPFSLYAPTISAMQDKLDALGSFVSSALDELDQIQRE